MNCGLLGRKLGHSYSPAIHGLLGDYPYALFEKEPEELESFLRSGDFTGLNVTIPYKKAVLPYCSRLTDCARKLGAVNTLVRQPDGTLLGHNSDFFGFSAMLQKSGLQVFGKKVLVLGSGGASATVVAVLEEKGAKAVVISRSGENNYENLSFHADAAVIVNATPVGMYPNNGESPLSLDAFPRLEGVLDLIYNPARTKLLLDAESRGLIAENGLYMLVAQAWESACMFTGTNIPKDRITKIYNELRNSMENIVLIGMPGCGKSTVGKLLAKRTGKALVDADEEIVKLAGCSIPEIFATRGEATFRELETKVLAELGRRSGLIIATGGGCVTRQENYPLLHQNGQIFWLQRDISSLPTDGRPLSKSNSLEIMYQKRKPLYESFADVIIDNNTSAETAAENILSRRYPMKILVLNGPNINMLGIREPDIYGKNTFNDLLALLEQTAEKQNVELEQYQSNHEGDLVDKIQAAYGRIDGIVINPAAYTHTSVAILDALKSVGIPAVEVHISKVEDREAFRQVSYAGMACEKTITGQGLDGYRQAIEYLVEKYKRGC